MKEYECVFSDIQTSFSASVAIYMNSCYCLLSSLHLSDEQMNDLLVQRKGEAWSTPQLQKDLEKRLGPSCAIYLLLIDKLNRRILLFGKKLKLTEGLKVRYPNIISRGKRLIAFRLLGLDWMEPSMKKRARSSSRISGQD